MAKVSFPTEIQGFHNLEDAAYLLGISRATIFRWIRKGKLQKTRIGDSIVIAQSEIVRLKNDTSRIAGGHSRVTQPDCNLP
ncbi:MAG: helix-turn-helix domain-containing protein [Candidatus Odinarchaeota archaeon]